MDPSKPPTPSDPRPPAGGPPSARPPSERSCSGAGRSDNSSSSNSTLGSSQPSPPSRLHIGTAGWAYSDWTGVVYPAEKPRGWHALDLLSCYFNLCEIDSSFYRIPSGKTSKSWTRRIAGHPDFLFTAKLWQGFTHQKEVDLPQGWLARRDVAAFRAFIDPLAESERLGCVLAQFPWSFRPTPENRDKLERLLDAFGDYPLAVEVRHAAWLQQGFLGWLAARHVAFTNIDQPIFGGSLGPTELVTADFFYVRLHGRNRDAWFDQDSTAAERYDYLYSSEELRPWVARIEGLQTKAQRGFVVTNNHFRGQAVANAIELSVDLKRPVPHPPESLARAYPAMRTLNYTATGPSHRPPPPEQLELF